MKVLREFYGWLQMQTQWEMAGSSSEVQLFLGVLKVMYNYEIQWLKKSEK